MVKQSKRLTLNTLILTIFFFWYVHIYFYISLFKSIINQKKYF